MNDTHNSETHPEYLILHQRDRAYRLLNNTFPLRPRAAYLHLCSGKSLFEFDLLPLG